MKLSDYNMPTQRTEFCEGDANKGMKDSCVAKSYTDAEEA